jgi:hypothetical protein
MSSTKRHSPLVNIQCDKSRKVREVFPYCGVERWTTTMFKPPARQSIGLQQTTSGGDGHCRSVCANITVKFCTSRTGICETHTLKKIFPRCTFSIWLFMSTNYAFPSSSISHGTMLIAPACVQGNFITILEAPSPCQAGLLDSSCETSHIFRRNEDCGGAGTRCKSVRYTVRQ